MTNSKRQFMLFFDITRWEGKFVINTDLPVRPIPRGAIQIPRKTAGPAPEAHICPRLTGDLQALLGAMIEREQDETDRMTPIDLIADMEAIVLVAYESSKQSTGVQVCDLMSKIVQPVMRISRCVQAVADDIGYSDCKETVALNGMKFISMLIDAACDRTGSGGVDAQDP